jgi:septum formation protein
MGADFLMSNLNSQNPKRRIVLASASPARKKLLIASGINAEIIVSGVDEEDPKLTTLLPSEMVLALAIMKAHAVREQVDGPAIIIGCDSTFEFSGKSLGKPLTPEVAIARSKELRGQSGYLHTGHCIIDTEQGIEISDISTSKVYFANMSDSEIESYVATGEPLNVAGGFTLDGLSAPFITRIEGDPTSIIGLSMPLLRKALNSLGIEWFDIVETMVSA